MSNDISGVLLEAFEDIHYSDTPPSLLFHYTSNEALISILSSGVVWATDLRYLNDASELKWAVQMFQGEVFSRIRRSDVGSYEAAVLGALDQWIERLIDFDGWIFVASFTENGNLLSQWRGYTKIGQGVSIGFDAVALKNSCATSDFRLGRCIYRTVEQFNFFRSLVDKLMGIVHRSELSRELSSSELAKEVRGRLDPYRKLVLQVLALIKHEAFEEENEWRAVSRLVSPSKPQKIRFRQGQTCLTPYQEVPIVDKSASLPIRKIVVGPGQANNEAMRAMTSLMRTVPLMPEGLEIQACRTELR